MDLGGMARSKHADGSMQRSTPSMPATCQRRPPPPPPLPSHSAAPALTVPVFANRPITGNAPLRVEVAMPSAQQLAGMNRLELDMGLGCPPPGRDACEKQQPATLLGRCRRVGGSRLPALAFVSDDAGG